MFDELAERSLMSPLAWTKHTYVRLAIIIHCKILALLPFFRMMIEVRQRVKTMKDKVLEWNGIISLLLYLLR